MAFAGAEPTDEVRLIEVTPNRTVLAVDAVRFHLLDTVVHAWDVAASLDRDYRPAPALLDLVAAMAERVPVGAARTRPGAAFEPPLAASSADSWSRTLAVLGRRV